jgi:hypothetical protein
MNPTISLPVHVRVRIIGVNARIVLLFEGFYSRGLQGSEAQRISRITKKRGLVPIISLVEDELET